jgi:flagellin
VTSSFNIEESDSFTIGLSSETTTLVTPAVAAGETRVYELTDTAGAKGAAYFAIDATTGALSRTTGDNFDSTTAANNAKTVVITAVDRINAITIDATGAGTGAANYSQNDNVATALKTAVSIEEANSWSIALSTKLDGFNETAGGKNDMHYRLSGADAADFKVGSTSGTLEEADSFANGVDFDHAVAGNNTRVVAVEAVDLLLENDLGNASESGAGKKDGWTTGPTKGKSDGTVGALKYTFDEAFKVTANFDKAAIAAVFDVSAGFTAADGTGVTMSLREGSGSDVADGKITFDAANKKWTLVDGTHDAGTSYTFTLRITDDTDPTVYADTLVTLTNTQVAADATETFTITTTESTVVAKDTVTVNITASDTYKDTITLNVIKAEDHLENVDVSTKAGAARAVTILDKALDEISSSQAKLGAIQNRLQHNIDNLSTGSMLTETAKGRIMDADFARETSELSKQQILGQAATSMLAQANQSKQSILALLQ